MIDGKNIFDQPINSELKTYEKIRIIATGQGNITQLLVCQIILTLKIITK